MGTGLVLAKLVCQQTNQDKKKWSRKRGLDSPKGSQIIITALSTIYVHTCIPDKYFLIHIRDTNVLMFVPT